MNPSKRHADTYTVNTFFWFIIELFVWGETHSVTLVLLSGPFLGFGEYVLTFL